MKRFGAYILFLLGSLFVALDVSGCLTFTLQRGKAIVYGRNFDWPVGVGAVFINHRNVQKTAFVLPPNQPMTWVSKYGSITFNQFSREVPVGGMNEHGLVIESMVSTAQHRAIDERKAINELQWMQYHLDLCKTVDEVIKSAGKLRISVYAASIHYLVSDAKGGCASIDFLDGKMVYRTGKNLPKHVLANKPYDVSLRTVASQKHRFARASNMLDKYDQKRDIVDYSFGVLDKVAQGDLTVWQVVYDIPQRKVHFRSKQKRKIKAFDLSKMDFSEAGSALMLDINNDHVGSVQDKFKPCTQAQNDKLIQSCLKAFKKAGIMQHIDDMHIQYIRAIVASCKPVEAK